MQFSPLAISILVVALGTLACYAQENPATGEGTSQSNQDGREQSGDSADDFWNVPKYRLALEAVVQHALVAAKEAGSIESSDAQRDEGLKRLAAAEKLLEKMPEHAEAISQLRKAHRAWAGVRRGSSMKSPQVNLLDLDAKVADQQLDLVESSMRTCLRQMARAAEVAADRNSEPKDRLAAALDVQDWGYNLSRVYGYFWVEYYPGLFVYATGRERPVEAEVYRGGFTTDYCELTQDVFETEGGGIGAALLPPTDKNQKDSDGPEHPSIAGIPPTIDAYRKDPKSWPRIRRVVPVGTVLNIHLFIWTTRVTNESLEIYAVPLLDEESKRQRYLDIGELCDWKDHPYTRTPKAEYLRVVEQPENVSDGFEVFKSEDQGETTTTEKP